MDFNNFLQFLNYKLGPNLVGNYLLSLLIFLLTIVVLKIFKGVGLRRIKKIIALKKTDIGDWLMKIIESLGWPLYLILALWVSFQFLVLPEKVEKYFSYLVLITLIFYAIKISQEIINFGAEKLVKKRGEEGKRIEIPVMNLLNGILKAGLWVIAFILILENLGVQITSLIAGLGIGGIAIAFALQSILSDIFACLSLYFDKPFEPGDFIIVGEQLGTVEKIGIKSTRIKSLWGEEVVIPNKELTETKVRNFKRLERRRIEFTFGVEYSTPTEKLKKIPEIVREIIEKIKLAKLDRVHFQKFGDFSLIFDVVYYVLTPSYNTYMDIQQEINFALKERFEKEKIRFAFPTQTIYINKIV